MNSWEIILILTLRDYSLAHTYNWIHWKNSSTYMMQHFHVRCPHWLMEQQATAISTWNIKRENVQYIFPKFNFVGEKGTTTTLPALKKWRKLCIKEQKYEIILFLTDFNFLKFFCFSRWVFLYRHFFFLVFFSVQNTQNNVGSLPN